MVFIYPGLYSRVASGSSVENGVAFNSSHIASGIGNAAHSSVCFTRSGLLTPQIVEVTRGSRIENCSAAAPT